jgi:(p)ppGpp synthase/HD superfamily hydrolase
MNITPLIQKAIDFGRAAHDSIGQKRKYNGDPYWTHTERVAETVASVGGTEDMIVAALLHDVLEDVFPHKPYYSANNILFTFGESVLNLVVALTDVYTKEAYPKLNRKARHELENQRLANISVEAKTIKLADLIDNTNSIVSEDPDFARVYLREKEVLLHHLAEGHPALLERAVKQTWDGKAKLGLHNPILSRQ